MSYNIATLNPAVSDWVSWTPTGSWTSNVTYQGWYRRNGEMLECRVAITCSGAPNNAALDINLPSGLTINTARLVGNLTLNVVGDGYLQDNSTGAYPCNVMWWSGVAATLVRVRPSVASGTYLLDNTEISSTVPFTWGTDDVVIVSFRVPISGWSSNIQTVQASTEYASNYGLADSDDTTSFAYGPSGSQMQNASLGATRARRVKFLTPIQLTDVLSIEVSEDGGLTWYPISSSVATNWWPYTLIHNANAAYGIGINAKVDSNTISVVLGQYKYWLNSSGTNWSSNTAKWRVRKQSGLGAGEVPPTVFAEYNTATALSVPNDVFIQWDTKVTDTHNAVTTGASWKFTAPIAGKYQISYIFSLASASITAGQIYGSSGIYVDGVRVLMGPMENVYANATAGNRICGAVTLSLNAGQYVQIKSLCSATRTLVNDALYNRITITRIGG